MTSQAPWTESLRAYLARELGIAGSVRAERIAGGQSNPTWFVDAGDKRLVLRQQPAGELLPSAHALDREFRVLRALQDSGVPVPRVLKYSEDRAVVGTPFYLMERVDGRIFHTAGLDGVSSADRRAMYRSAAETLAKLHAVDWAALGLSDYGKHGDYFPRQLRRWSRQWEASRQRDILDIDRLIAWFPEHMPAEGETTICHGDYRFGNLMFAPSSTAVVAVLDWELSTLGDPLADLGYFCMLYHVGSEYAGVADLEERAALGIPRQEELVADYNRLAGTRRALLPFHVAFAFFRFSVIFAGIEDRARRGNASDPNAAARAAGRADAFSRTACEVLGI